MPSQQGPLGPGQYRDKDGKIVGGYSPAPKVQGPVPPGASTEIFRAGGGTTKKPSSSKSGGSSRSSSSSSSSSSVQSSEPNAFGAESISPAPTFKQQLMDKGGYSFLPNLLIQKGLGKVGDYEQMNMKGQPIFAGETGKRTSQLVEVGQYFIPYYGQALGAIQGVEYLARPKNYAGKGTEGALGVGLSVLGVAGGIAGVSKILGKVKSTNVISSTRILNEADNVINSNTIAEAKNLKLLTDDTILNAVQTQTTIEPIADDLYKFKSVSKGVSRNYKGTSPLGEVYDEPQPFVGAVKGIIKGDEVTLTNRGLDVSNPINTNTILFEGKTQTGKKVNANFLDDLTLSGEKLKGETTPSGFSGGGVSIIDDEVSLTFSRFKQMKDGRLEGQEIRGFDIAKKAKQLSDDSFNIVTKGGITKSKPPIDTQALQTIIDKAVITNIVKNTKNVKPSFRGGLSPGMFEPEQALRQTNHAINNQMQLQNDADLQKLFTTPTLDFVDLNDMNKDIVRLSNPSASKSRESQKSISAKAVTQIEREIERQVERTITNVIPHQALPSRGAIPIPIPLLDFENPKKKRKGSNILNRAYKLQVKRKGKYRDVLSGLTRGRALQLGEDMVSKELSRTFRLLPQGVTSEPDSNFNISNKFRKPKRGNDIDTFIQKSMFSLESPEEKFLIQKSRKKGRNVFSGLIS